MNLSYTQTLGNPFLVASQHKNGWCTEYVEASKRLRVMVYTKMEDVPHTWDVIALEQNAMLSRPFLQALEACPPTDSRPVYLLFYEYQQPVGLAYCQLIDFKASESISLKPIAVKNSDANAEKECLFTSVGKYFKEFVAKRVAFHALVCGNLLLTGEHGHIFVPSVDKKRAFEMLSQGIDIARDALEKELNLSISITLFKEYFEKTIADADALRESGAYEFQVQPNMIFHLQPEWNTFEDYMTALASKYRVRAKRAFKKGSELECKELSISDLEEYEEQMHNLYKAIASTAEFNLIYLQKGYFLNLKRHLKQDFCVKGYFINGELVGFLSALRNGRELEAHFLGLKEEYNFSHQLYLNILYELVRIGIDWQVNDIIYARTALEIKSSVGAEPYNMYNYLRHRNNLSSKMLKSLFEYLQPEPPVWQPRHPFLKE
jgi:predicted N-acyltransferase